ncbi:MAG: FtsQ-type POTRA domain-containing protein [Methylacidiphilales bacterium]|nr:FtsQ-type POTRA domain-containing protein [Candidatus Methylacidiphilales bacterium]MDW8349792.1 FtsQ-type POTRA domain-containing protein [Verrucomicrobiae bacterium]
MIRWLNTGQRVRALHGSIVNLVVEPRNVRLQRKKWGRILMGTGGVVVLFGALSWLTHQGMEWALRRFVYENEKFTLREIQLDLRGNIVRRQVLEAANVHAGQNLMQINLAQVQKAIEALPYVAQAQVERVLPDKLIIKVEERLPAMLIRGVALGQKKEDLFYVGWDGTVMRPRPGETLRSLPEIVGLRWNDLEEGIRLNRKEISAALDFLKALNETPMRSVFDVKTIDVSQPMMLHVTTTQGYRVIFRQELYAAQLNRLSEIIDYATARYWLLNTVDLTPSRNVPVTYREYTVLNTPSAVSNPRR